MFNFLQGGKFLYIEHIRAPLTSWTYIIQRVVDPVWYYLFSDGCSLVTTPWVNIEKAGFSNVEQQQVWTRVRFRLIKQHLKGVATKGGLQSNL